MPMSEFIQKPKRSVELPLGCKDLLDLEEIRNWAPVIRPNWGQEATDKLAYMEGYLSRIMGSSGKFMLVSISRNLDQGWVTVVPDADLAGSVVLAWWNGSAQQQAVRVAFEEAGLAPVTE